MSVELEIPSGKMVVIDPIIDKNDLAQFGYVVTFENGGKCVIIVELGIHKRVKRVSFHNLAIKNISGFQAGVDSGQLLFMDYYKYINNYLGGDFGDYGLKKRGRNDKGWVMEKPTESMSYDMACYITCSDNCYGLMNKYAFVTSTGWGDGVYYLENLDDILDMVFMEDG